MLVVFPVLYSKEKGREGGGTEGRKRFSFHLGEGKAKIVGLGLRSGFYV